MLMERRVVLIFLEHVVQHLRTELKLFWIECGLRGSRFFFLWGKAKKLLILRVNRCFRQQIELC